jgi:hypothetical protein
VVVGSVLDWLTVKSVSPTLTLDQVSGLRDLGYRGAGVGPEHGVGVLTLFAWVVLILIGILQLARRHRPRAAGPAGIASGSALVLAGWAGWSILHHQSTAPAGSHVSFHVAAGLWVTITGAAAGLLATGVVVGRQVHQELD